MKPGKIYLKIFLSFLAVLVVTEILIFTLFMAYVGKSFKQQADENTLTKIAMAREMIEEVIQDKIQAGPAIEISRNTSLIHLVRRLGDLSGARVWLSSSGGEVLVKSFDGPVPAAAVEKSLRGRAVDLGGFKLYHLPHRISGAYTSIPITMAGGPGQLHILFKKSGPPHPDKGFGLGLVLIGAAVALLVIPVSRLITRPIKELRRSALQIAEGDLSHRASIRSKDEIGELSRTFNSMADRLAGMIRGGKELTANLSHQLRSPLARIRMAEELMREKLERENTGGLRDHLKDVQEDVEEMDRLIGQILALSKLDIHEAALRTESVDPAEVLEGLLHRLRPAMDQRGLQVKTSFNGEGMLHADREAMVTIFSNLLENASRYTPEKGTVALCLTMEKGVLSFSVTNTTSRPFTSEEIGKIFDPFYRIEGSGAGGTGLGLAITKKMIMKQGGTIHASQSPEGLCISLTLPSAPLPEGS